MTWSIPAKTFLLGEYIALQGGPALLLTTAPCFELRTLERPGLQGIHPESPAARFWSENGDDTGLQFIDPYQGIGGMGASSAQFIGTYLASLAIKQEQPDVKQLMQAYWHYAWDGQGYCPSGYDLLAQSSNCCVYINQAIERTASFSWPFTDMAFILAHTGQKLATHQHLKQTVIPDDITALCDLVEAGKKAFDLTDSMALAHAVSAYAEMLSHYNLIAEHSGHLLHWINNQPEVLAAKGCGAMGADILLILVSQDNCAISCEKLATHGLRILATSHDLYQAPGLITMQGC